jgi:hypothetical protein
VSTFAGKDNLILQNGQGEANGKKQYLHTRENFSAIQTSYPQKPACCNEPPPAYILKEQAS